MSPLFPANLSFCHVSAQSSMEEQVALQQVAHQTFVETFGANYSPSDLEAYVSERLTMAALQQELAETGTTFYLIRYGEKVAGYFKWIYPCHRYLKAPEKWAAPCLLERFYLLSIFHAAGIAPVALQFVLSMAKKGLGADMIYLSVWEHNLRAQRFYQHFGFRIFDSCIYKVGSAEDHELLYSCLL